MEGMDKMNIRDIRKHQINIIEIFNTMNIEFYQIFEFYLIVEFNNS